MTMSRRTSMFATRGSVRVRIADGQVIDGKLSPTVKRLVRTWVGLRREALMRNWQAARNDEPLDRIEGLE
jgi:hypothetical protein